jgi:hypothetical protein
METGPMTSWTRRLIMALAVSLALGCGREQTAPEPATPPPAPTEDVDASPEAKAASPKQAPAQRPALDDAKAPPETTVMGKYSRLLAIIDDPKAAKERGGFADLGRLETSPGSGQDDIGPAYWVYSAPRWYAWGEAHEAKLEAPPGADASGKYAKLQKVIPAIDDQGRYGGFWDDGHSKRAEYKGIQDIPPGYWVYMPPNWYVWGEVHPLPLVAPPKADMDGKYAQLLRVLPAPDDVARLGELKDEGRLQRHRYKGASNIPEGYWVYVAPNWYVWGVSKEAASGPASPKPVRNKPAKGINKR